MELPLRRVLLGADQEIDAVYFPETCMISMIAALDGGDAAEVGLVGREGMVGIPLLLGSDRSPTEAMCQGSGIALRLSTSAFREEMDRSLVLRTTLLRYAQAFLEQVTQTAACNGRHLLEQRLARWMLMAHDRAEGDAFQMTHEFLAMMLGVRRAGISVAAGTLQKAGLIRYERGRMLIADRPGLEHASCECYGVVRRAYDRLVGPP
ncbi:Crp/Fnr family transcriptional regulator [Siccirubricoccus deserti]|uniref:Crp/Fnr family transcriptional regulator n=1 Tax=Siccirubricoccus deserti TaxID=2013562 RepID=UPI001E49C22A|nr:Crp/Fnr family transcriptional regulator [Siccirubricoccus deserti]